jgi:LAO/AO transport system kinase
MTAEAIVSGDLRALARAASLVEERKAGALLAELAPHAGRALTIGLTGAPGTGKSTLVDQLTGVFRAQEKRVAIVAVDPSSPFSGGAILGDRVRMMRHHGDAGVFIRSMATRGSMGGLAAATADMVRLLDAAGFDIVLVETVGVGQDEVDIARLAQVTVVVLMPGMGDDVQMIKSGLLEIADLFVINKADQPGAERLERDLHYADHAATVLRTVATEGTGVAELAAAILERPRRQRVAAHDSSFPIDHLGIAVKSLDDALTFWRDRLGFAVAGRETVEGERVHVAMLPAGSSRIELLEGSSPDSVISQFVEKRGGGLHHVAIRVPNLAAAAAKLQESGARVLNEPRRGAGGHLYVFVHPASTGGVLLELIEDSH